MATILLVISALYFFVTNGMDTLIGHEEKENIGSPLYMQIISSKTEFFEKTCPIISFISIFVLMPTTISLAFHINWFIAFGITILLKFIIQGITVGIYNMFFYRGNPFFSMVLSFILGIVTMIIGLLV